MKADVWEATQPAGLEELPARSPLLNAKVMMLDDEPLMTELIQTHLEEEGYSNFVVANDPRAALGLLHREQPGLLLLDLMMPEMSGFEVLESIRADRELRYLPVIVLTAASGADAKLRALKLGATDFLSKPVDASELVLRVRNTLAFQEHHNRLIHFDTGTGLPNERLFSRGLAEVLSRRSLVGGMVTLFSIIVPECRQLRESMDQGSADALAKVVARRLERLAGSAPMLALGSSAERAPRVARLDTERFGLLLEGLADVESVQAQTRALLATLAEPVSLGTHAVSCKPWIGISISPGDGHNAETLFKSADLAATHARERALVQFVFASQELNRRSFERFTLGLQLRGAAERGELRLHYQPKVDARSGAIVGAEALVRWQHPEQGLIPPIRFIALAEEIGIIGEIGDWVMERACRDAASWVEAGFDGVKVAINVARPQFVKDRLASTVRQALFDSGLPGSMLVIELTESMLMDDIDDGRALMGELRSLGVSLSIDDFGTGYSSLAYLKGFPLDELKVDRSFVKDLPGRPIDAAIVATVIQLGHSLGLRVTAEGVESVAQLECLRELGCDSYQGYHYSRPLPLEDFVMKLAASAPA